MTELTSPENRTHICDLVKMLQDQLDIHSSSNVSQVVVPLQKHYYVHSTNTPSIYIAGYTYICNDTTIIRTQTTRAGYPEDYRIEYNQQDLTLNAYDIACRHLTLMLDIYQRQLICETLV